MPAKSGAEAAGGGAVAAVQLARLAGSSTLFTAVGDDELGAKVVPELERRRGHRARCRTAGAAAPRIHLHRRGGGEDDHRHRRASRPAPVRRPPVGELAEADGVYFVSGDAGCREVRARGAACSSPRRARSPTLAEGRVELDALVRSRSDEGETLPPGRHRSTAARRRRDRRAARRDVHVRGRSARALPGRRRARAAPGHLRSGDSFAAGLTFGLAEGLPMDDAVALAARSGAAALTRRGAHGA